MHRSTYFRMGRIGVGRPVRWTLSQSDQTKLAADLLERLQGLPEVLLRMVGRDDRPDPGLTAGHRREDDGRGEHALLPQEMGELDGLGLLPGDHRADGRLADPGVEPAVVQPGLEL